MRTVPSTPYSHQLEGRDPIEAMRSTIRRVEGLTANWRAAEYERSYAPGKWTARQVLIHLAQSELALGSRARLALSTPNYIAQPFDQDAWIDRDSALSGSEAAQTFLTIARMNAAFFERLSERDRDVPFSHPEYGNLTIDWVLHQMAGHQIHHLKQLESIVLSH